MPRLDKTKQIDFDQARQLFGGALAIARSLGHQPEQVLDLVLADHTPPRKPAGNAARPKLVAMRAMTA